MFIKYTPIISIICTLITSLIAFFSYRNNLRNKNKTDIVERVKSDTLISTKLDMVITGTAEVKSEIKNLNNRFDQISERVAICEESMKQAHGRIDKIEFRLVRGDDYEKNN